jgi:hypothetical protein
MYINISTQLFQIRFKVFPELSGKVEYERERLNTVLKCGRPYKKLYLVRYILQDCQPPVNVGPYARSKLRFKTFKIKYFQGFWAQNTIKMKPRSKTNPLVYSAEKEKTNDTKVIKHQTYWLLHFFII